MPTWNQIVSEIESYAVGESVNIVRNKYITEMVAVTGRPVICYYSGWLVKKLPNGSVHPECAITDNDMNGMMAVVHGLQRDSGLDIILHTPGGEIEAARAIVEYLYKMFGFDLRIFVPHMAMSAGTMWACAAREIVLAKHSCLGPIDPQIRGLPAMGIIAEVERAIEEIKNNPQKLVLWQQIFSKYPPAFISDCERAIEGAKVMVTEWLHNNMFNLTDHPEKSAKSVVEKLMDYNGTSEHGHHFLIDKCKSIGLNISNLEDNPELQEAVLSVHHSYMATFTQTNSIKIIENSNAANWIVET